MSIGNMRRYAGGSMSERDNPNPGGTLPSGGDLNPASLDDLAVTEADLDDLAVDIRDVAVDPRLSGLAAGYSPGWTPKSRAHAPARLIGSRRAHVSR